MRRPDAPAAKPRGLRAALYAVELFLILLWGLATLAVGTFASWWGALGMFASFIVGGVFRDAYNLRIGRLIP